MRLHSWVLQSSVIYSEGNDSKIRKVSRSEPVELNETTFQHSITSQEFFLQYKNGYCTVNN